MRKRPPTERSATKRSRLATSEKPWFEHFHFFRSWLANPFGIAAVAPSGPALSRLITSEIHPDAGPVIELGPGTGVFTKALIARGIRENDLTLIENSPDFVRNLRRKFPMARILSMDASLLSGEDHFSGIQAGAAVSGLPLLSIPPRQVASILAGSFSCLRPDAQLYQFTYGPRCPVPRATLNRLGLEAVRIGWTPLNIPPASVYRIFRRKH